MKPSIRIALAITATILCCPAAHEALAQCSPQQLAKVWPNDEQSFENCASAAAISGTTAVIGAPYHTTTASSDGAAYVFIKSGVTWAQQAKLVASDPGVGDLFGTTVAVNGDTAVVGAPYHGVTGSGGAAYVFVRSGSVWSFQSKLNPLDYNGSQYVGSAVAISGDTAVVGAFGDSTAGSGAGAAYVFVRSGTTWAQQAKLIGSDLGAQDDFAGFSVAISGNTAVIGADMKYDLALNSRPGAAYVFVRSGTIWSQQGKLVASDATTSDSFLGYSVAIDTDTVISGGYQFDLTGKPDAGAAYVYTRSGTTWTQQAKLTASDAATADNFGWSVGVSGNVAIIGSSKDTNPSGTNAGSAYLFVRSGTTWAQQGKVTGSDTGTNDAFGSAVAADGDYAVIGAVSAAAPVGAGSGAAYIFSMGCGIPVCCPGDFDTDHAVTTADIPAFVSALLAGGACPALPACCPGDLNADLVVNGADISGFVAKLLAGGTCP